MADFSLQALHDEIEADPLGLGYKEVGGAWKGDGEIAAIINTKNYTVDRAEMDTNAARAATTYNAYNNLSIDEQEYIQWVTQGDGEVRITADLKFQLTGRDLCVNGSPGTGNDSNSWWLAADRGTMCPAFLALIEAAGSRAEVLWGQGIIISTSQVAYAANV